VSWIQHGIWVISPFHLACNIMALVDTLFQNCTSSESGRVSFDIFRLLAIYVYVTAWNSQSRLQICWPNEDSCTNNSESHYEYHAVSNHLSSNVLLYRISCVNSQQLIDLSACHPIVIDTFAAVSLYSLVWYLYSSWILPALHYCYYLWLVTHYSCLGNVNSITNLSQLD